MAKSIIQALIFKDTTATKEFRCDLIGSFIATILCIIVLSADLPILFAFTLLTLLIFEISIHIIFKDSVPKKHYNKLREIYYEKTPNTAQNINQ